MCHWILFPFPFPWNLFPSILPLPWTPTWTFPVLDTNKLHVKGIRGAHTSDKSKTSRNIKHGDRADVDHFHTRDLDHSNGIIIVERSIRPRTSIEIRLQLFFSLHMYTYTNPTAKLLFVSGKNYWNKSFLSITTVTIHTSTNASKHVINVKQSVSLWPITDTFAPSGIFCAIIHC